MELDIRQTEAVEVIRVSDPYAVDADVLVNTDVGVIVASSRSRQGSNQTDCREYKEYLDIRDRTHAENLIKGLQKAINVGWFG